MANPPPTSVPGGGLPHALIMKVLRLARPSLATQTPLPHTNFGNGLDLPPVASLAYPSPDADSTSFPLTTLLTLPSAFGAAYVGETFTCTLCANDVREEDEAAGRGKRSISAVKFAAELQTPSEPSGKALQLSSAERTDETNSDDLPPGSTVQRTLRHELKEEGPHVLAVTVTYTETSHDREGGASGGRVRSFRKVYQFVAQQLIAVRSKITERSSKRTEKDSGSRQWVLEAQLENVGEAAAVVLEKVWLDGRKGLRSKDLGGSEGEVVVLKPGDVEQVMFLLDQKLEEGEAEAEVFVSGNQELARLNVDWRGPVGERGSLTTGWLASRGR
ncbi:hypothetical protein LTR78_006296 [Recurvomyces mirabilis]|uniref:Trafficking protein particle complex subunit 13 n=1 Tax=Recurvomyces mirabilis TaxID=574656 RepID=A0AAE0WL53_9PEZI|nr:hypothetical protein LTR78_006296 [Recurvomyces mirabilis]KAK5152185.1 hypothetical protein LTS14_008560 [Recurvomyces mirabilis]